jgi:hypothetical protein
MKALIPLQKRVGDATICNQLTTSVMFSKTLNVFIYVIFCKLAANVPRLGAVAGCLIVYCKDIKISIGHISVLEKLNQPLR